MNRIRYDSGSICHAGDFLGGTAIENINKSVCLWILYDGVENSVFQSQVLNVVNQQLIDKVYEKIVVVSFEDNLTKAQEALSHMHMAVGLEFVIFKKSSFIGAFSLSKCIDNVCDQIFKVFPQQVVARGPIAGYIALKAMGMIRDDRQLHQDANNLPKVTIQARGLLYKEHQMFVGKGSWNPLKNLVNWFVGRQKLALERTIYAEANLEKMAFEVKIEAVTSYLADYLIEEFGASWERINIASNDYVTHLPTATIQQYRRYSRSRLGLSGDVLVYCYSGSAKPWQCAKETVELFWELFEKNTGIFFLVLTHEPEAFAKWFLHKGLPAENYLVMEAKDQDEYFKLLCAADIGVVLRDDNVVNWVSRPVKVLDYLACNLKLHHNNTIGWVIEMANRQRAQLEAEEQAAAADAAVFKEVTKVTAAKLDTKVRLEPKARKVIKVVKAVEKSKEKVKEVGKKAAITAKAVKEKAKEKVAKNAQPVSKAKNKTVKVELAKKTATKPAATAKKRSKSQAHL